MSSTVLRAIDVFTPNDFPALTYIQRDNSKLEQAMLQALDTPNAVISVSGPSKSGKTVLAERVIGGENLIMVSGAELSRAEDLWDRVFDILGEPLTIATQQIKTDTNTGSGEVGAKGGLPYLAEVNGKATLQRSRANATATTQTTGRRGMSQAEALLSGSPLVIFIDDFHYMERTVQTAIARQIRAGSGRGIRFCVASVPHRSDDVVRSNHELRGRTTHIDSTFWSVEDLVSIGLAGFPQLLMRIPDEDVRGMAIEACGSPQLMQQICLQGCLFYGVSVKRDTWANYTFQGSDRKSVLELAATHTDYSSLLRDLHTGPRQRGQTRNPHSLVDGSTGDVYRAVLLGLALGAPATDIPYAQLLDRTHSVCVGSQPTGQGITSAVEQMVRAANKMYPDQRIIDWDATTGSGDLSIVDPYLLFYLRNSGRLASLGGV